MNRINENELKEIFADIKEDKESGIKTLFEKYNKTIYAIAFSILKNKENSEDVAQEVYSKLLKLDNDKFPEHGEASWIYTVTKNETIAFLRKQKKNIDIDDLYSLESESDEIDDIVDMNSYYALISNLNPIDKEIISLRILSDFTFEKISKMLNIPLGTVQWRYYKALHSIRLAIGNIFAFVVAFSVLQSSKLFLKNSETIEDTTLNANQNSQSDLAGDTMKNVDYYGQEYHTDYSYSANDAYEFRYDAFNLVFSILSIFFIVFAIFFALKRKIKIKKSK